LGYTGEAASRFRTEANKFINFVVKHKLIIIIIITKRAVVKSSKAVLFGPFSPEMAQRFQSLLVLLNRTG
jgi:hypothetical protein